ncbi:unnamed protein product [Gongylonema pulchrum]|nr:unnamed protein product [Gongylonema pulchrum]
MKPLLTNASPTLLETLPSFLAPFARMFTTEQQLSLYTQADDSDSVNTQSTPNENPFLRVRYYNSTGKLSMNNGMPEL